MNKIDTVKAIYSFDNVEENSKYLSDDFQGTDSVGGPAFDKAGWVGMGQMFKGSIPDIKVLIDDIQEEGDSVMVTGRTMGTFTNDFDLTSMDMGVIPATGKMVEFPASTTQISFNGDLVSKFHGTDTGPDAGLPGMLKALGGDAG